MPLGPVTPGSYVSATADTRPAPFTTLTIAPSATMPVIGADLQAFELALVNGQNTSLADVTALGTHSGDSDGARVYVRSLGWFLLNRADAQIPVTNWIVAATGGGNWIRQRQDYRVVVMNVYAPATGTNTRPYANPMVAGDEVTGDALGAVQAGDIIRGTFSIAFGNVAGDYAKVGMFVTQDNGVTYTQVSPYVTIGNGLDVNTVPTFDTHYDFMSFSFAYAVTGSPSFAGWSFRGQGNNTSTIYRFGSGWVEVVRP